MKIKLVVISLVVMLICVVLCSCSYVVGDKEIKPLKEVVIEDLVTEVSSELEFSNSFSLNGFVFPYRDDSSLQSWGTGNVVTDDLDIWVSYNTPSYFDNDVRVENFTEVIDVCESYMLQSISCLDQYFSEVENMVQTVISHEEVQLNDFCNALKVIGTVSDSGTGNEVGYCAYYMINKDESSEDFNKPLFVCGVSLNSNDKVESYLDTAMSLVRID